MIKTNNVFVVDDDESVRKSLRMMLKAAGFNTATFSSADEFLATCTPKTMGCIILDVNMPGMDGFKLQEELHRRGSLLPIIFLTGQGSIRLSVHAIKEGAMDFLTKPVDGDKLLACVNQALDKCSQLQNQAQESQSKSAKLATLTAREKVVMSLIIDGLTSKEIATRLNISYRTVENYRANVMQKTGAKRSVDLVKYS